MRLRNVPGSREDIANSEFVIQNPEKHRGEIVSLFPSKQPLFIEIGMGKGQFITTLAKNNPDINYIGIEKYSSVFYGARIDGAVDRNNSEGRGGAIPALGEIRNCHINVGTGKELTIKELAELVKKTVRFEGDIIWDAGKPNGTPRKLINVDKLHRLGWTHKVEIETGVEKLYVWYQKSLK